ncbi:hypothetical protein DFH07DRAFT_771075 [Mycena maculata]|uniref:F-box domain-containing protein n=1 Tax=Mycena maculata TaxID=230809 RepID=A0AAD7JEY9_9AGAR|nr:hypothetical protein DFH07DRAFT_771075 [Mycena maculata]
MYRVPSEIMHTILQDVLVAETSDLITLRFVSKTLNAIATPRAFHTIIMHESLWSSEAVCFLQTCDESVTSAVRRVVFEGAVEEEEGEEEEEECLPELQQQQVARRNALKTAFSGLHKFPHLERLRVHFDPSYEIYADQSSDPSYLLQLQFDILAALSAHPLPSLFSLSLNNMVAVPNKIYALENFHMVFRLLDYLRISIRSDVLCATAQENGDDIEDRVMDFWDRSIPYIIRNAPAISSLTLCDDGNQSEYVFDPVRSPLKAIILPRLTSLSLYDFSFESDALPKTDLVGFILSQKATLTHLVLDGCFILLDTFNSNYFPRFWHTVLRTFMHDLCVLQHFTLNSSVTSSSPSTPTSNGSAFRRDPRFQYKHTMHNHVSLEYHVYDSGEPIDGEEGDLKALEALLATVEKARHSNLRAV